MRNLKKILALVLSLMMVLSVMVTASATDFVDDADITNKEAVEVMSALGILAGANGEFNPQGTLYRDQAAKIIAFMKLGPDTDKLVEGITTTAFSDVTSGWAMKYIAYCADLGIINGNDGKFFPGNTLTGYEFGKMVLNAAGIEGTYTGSNWKVNVAAALKANGLLSGLDKIVLSANITREQAAQLAWNAMKWGEKVEETVTSNKYVIVALSSTYDDYDVGKSYDSYAAAQKAAVTYSDGSDTSDRFKLGRDYNITSYEVTEKVTTTKDSLAEVNYNVASTYPMEVTSIVRDSVPSSKNYGKLIATAGSYKWVVEDYSAIGTWVNVYYNKSTKAVYTATEQSVTVDVFGMSLADWKATFTAADFGDAADGNLYATGVKQYVNAVAGSTTTVAYPGNGDSFVDASQLVFLYNASTGKYTLKSALVDNFTVEKVTVSKNTDGTLKAALGDGTVIYNAKLDINGKISVDKDYTDIDWSKYYNTVTTKSFGYFNCQKVAGATADQDEYYLSEVETVTGTVSMKNSANLYAVVDGNTYYSNHPALVEYTNVENKTGLNYSSMALNKVYTLYLDVYGNYFGAEAATKASNSDLYYVTGIYSVAQAVDYGTVVCHYAQVVAMDGTVSSKLVEVGGNTPTVSFDKTKLYTFELSTTPEKAAQGIYEKVEFSTAVSAIDAAAGKLVGVNAVSSEVDLKSSTGKVTVTDTIRLDSNTQYLYINDEVTDTQPAATLFSKTSGRVVVGTANVTIAANKGFVVATRDADGNYVAQTVVIISGTAIANPADMVYVAAAYSTIEVPYTAANGTAATGYVYTVYNAVTGEKSTMVATNSQMGEGAGYYTYTEVVDGVVTFNTTAESTNVYYTQFYEAKYGTKITAENYDRTTGLSDGELADAVIVDLRSAAAQKALPAASAADMAYLKAQGYSVVFDTVVKQDANNNASVITLYITEVIADADAEFYSVSAEDNCKVYLDDTRSNYVVVTIDNETYAITLAKTGTGDYTWGDLADLLPTGATLVETLTDAIESSDTTVTVTAHDGTTTQAYTITLSGF